MRQYNAEEVLQGYPSLFSLQFNRFPFSFMKILCHLLILTIAVCLEVPKIIFSTSYNSYSYSAFPNDTCKQIQIGNNYIFRLGSNNVVSVTNKTSLTSITNLLNYTYTINGTSLTQPTLIQNFNVDHNETYLTIALSNGSKILNLMNFTQKAASLTSFDKVLFDNLVFTGLKINTTGNNLLYNVKYVSQMALGASSFITFTISGYVLPNRNNCQCSQSPNNSYLVYWDQYSNVFVYNYTNTAVPPSLIGSLPSNITAANLTQAIFFSPDGEYFILEADAALPVTIVSLSPASPLSTRSFAFNGTINRAMFLDSSSAFIVLFNDSAYTIASAALLAVLDSVALTVQTSVIEIDYALGKVYFCKSSAVDVYSTSYPSGNCSTNCAVCTSSLACLACSPSYSLVNSSCTLTPNTTANASTLQTNSSLSNTSTPSNTTSSNSSLSNSTSNASASPSSSNSTIPQYANLTNNSINSTTNNVTNVINVTNTTSLANTTNQIIPSNSSSSNASSSSNTTDNSTDLSNLFDTNIQNDTMFVLIMPDGSYVIIQITFTQAKIINTTQQALKYSNGALQKLMVLLTASPFIYIFLGNIQFFTISSLYALLNLPLPLDLYNSLKSTVLALNTNIFVIFGVNLTVPGLGVERVTDQRALELGVSTLFLPNNYQSIILTSFIIALVYFLRMLISQCKGKAKRLYYIISQNRNLIVFGLLVSGFIQLILPSADVYSNPQSYNYDDKINQSIQFLMIGLVIAFVGLFSAAVGYKHLKSSKRIEPIVGQGRMYKPKPGSTKLLKRQRDNIYLVLINVLFPLLVVLQQPLYFLIVGLMVLLFGAAKAICCTVIHRANKIALTIYPIIFHLCFVVFYFSSSSKVIVIAEIACLLIYFIGSLHQFITILYDFFAFIFRIVKANCLNTGKVTPYQSEQVDNKAWFCNFTTARMSRSRFKHSKITIKNASQRNHSQRSPKKKTLFTSKNQQTQHKQELLFASAVLPHRDKRVRVGKAKPVTFSIKHKQPEENEAHKH